MAIAISFKSTLIITLIATYFAAMTYRKVTLVGQTFSRSLWRMCTSAFHSLLDTPMVHIRNWAQKQKIISRKEIVNFLWEQNQEQEKAQNLTNCGLRFCNMRLNTFPKILTNAHFIIFLTWFLRGISFAFSSSVSTSSAHLYHHRTLPQNRFAENYFAPTLSSNSPNPSSSST